MEKIIFLDRDGVINKFPGRFKYVESLEDFEFLPRSKEAITLLTNNGYHIFVVSNQAGVTKGIYSQETLDKINRKMIEGIEGAGGKIERVLYCIHTDAENCDCRKPKVGLITQALQGYKYVDLKEVFFVGDSIRDVKTGKSAGCKTILVLSGRAEIKDRENWEVEPDYIEDNLFKAVENIILKQNK